jgi:malate dehydrogenase (oxaloacetate-decarboxylating)(NADP+)
LEEFARVDQLKEGLSLLDVVKTVRPNIILGLSGQKGLFTEEVIKEMYKHEKTPVIFALSNPTSKCECTAEEAYNWTEGNCLFASGSPFDDVVYKGKTFFPAQGNNMFIFPGIGLAAVGNITPNHSESSKKDHRRHVVYCVQGVSRVYR